MNFEKFMNLTKKLNFFKLSVTFRQPNILLKGLFALIMKNCGHNN